jgi:hypothetical protein
MEKNMNTRKLLVSILMLVSVLLSACASATATPLAPTANAVPIQSTLLKIPMSVSFDSSWHMTDNLPDIVTIQNNQVDFGVAFNIVTDAKLADPADGHLIPFPADFVSWIKSDPDFTALEFTNVKVGGIVGVQIDATPIATRQKVFLSLNGNNWNLVSASEHAEHWRFIDLGNVTNGERLLILSIAPADQFQSLVPGAQKILDTVVFSKAAATTFSSSKFKLPMTLSYGSDWSLTEYPNQVYLKNNLRMDGWQLAINLVDGATIADPNSAAEIPWPQDLAAYLKSNPYIEAGEPEPITFGGFDGIQIDAYAKYTGEKRSFIRLAGAAEGWLYLDAEEMWRFIVLGNVNGERLVISMIASPPIDEFATFADEAQKVLDTVTFSKPAATIFSPKKFNPPITVRYGPEWSIADNYSDVFTLSYAGHDAGVSFMNVKNTKYADGIAFPDDFVTWIQSPDSLFQVEDSKPVLVGGFKGTQINGIGTCGEKTMWIILSGTGWWCPSGGHMGFIYLDNVNGERVLIEIQASPGDKDYEFIVEESQKVLDTVVFSKP